MDICAFKKQTDDEVAYEKETEEILEDINNDCVPNSYTTCPDCGCKINFDNDGGNGFCINCAPNH